MAINTGTGTGLDSLVDIINTDPGLLKRIPISEINAGAEAADGMNKLIVEAIEATGIANNSEIDGADVRDLNHHLQTNHQALWIQLHGDDENGEETGFHLVQGDGGETKVFGYDAINTVMDQIYHVGFSSDGYNVLNEDGDKNASVFQIASYLDRLLEGDLQDGTLKNSAVAAYQKGTSDTGLDLLVNTITEEEGLQWHLATSEIAEAARAADAMNAILLDAIRDTGVAMDRDFSGNDVKALNDYIRGNHGSEWRELHGDSGEVEASGFHIVRNVGTTTKAFGYNVVDTIAEQVYQLGFDRNGHILEDEDGNAGQSVNVVANFLDGLLADELASGDFSNPPANPPANPPENPPADPPENPPADPSVNPAIEPGTGTGLDSLVDIINTDPGLLKRIPISEINAGAEAADGMNKLIVEAIEATGIANNSEIDGADVRDLNHHLQTNHQALWIQLHGDDENGEETGFHLVQGDGGETKLFGYDAINTVMDQIYHVGFSSDGYNVLNEDGDKNASVFQIASYLDRLLEGDLQDGTLKNSAVAAYQKGTSDTGLDLLVNTITEEEGLQWHLATSEIAEAARAADAMNAILLDAIRDTGVAMDRDFSGNDVKALNDYIRGNHGSEWRELHGDSGEVEASGFHIVRNVGTTTKAFGYNVVDTIAEQVYQLGFDRNGHILEDEDGNAGQSVNVVANFLDGLLADELADEDLSALV